MVKVLKENYNSSFATYNLPLTAAAAEAAAIRTQPTRRLNVLLVVLAWVFTLYFTYP